MEWEGARINKNMPRNSDNASKMSLTAGHQVHADDSKGYRERSIKE